ncbi:hypothetical protein ACHAXT_006217 [Thalassiosira profunda]
MDVVEEAAIVDADEHDVGEAPPPEATEGKRRSSRKSEEITFLAGEACLYSVVKRSAVSLGWKLVGEDANERAKRNCDVIWIDKSFYNDRLFLSIQPWQRINHFPGMTNICRKARLAQSLELMRKKFPRDFSFYPTTYVLPQGLAAFRTMFANGQSKGTYIVKPDGSAQGKGIFLTRRIEDVENLSSVCVAQQYIRNPLLIEKKKFDLRIYVLVTSCSPLRLYLFRDGLVRICTEDYKRPTTSNMDDRCMHLTNYSVNKRSDKYERDEKGAAPSNLGSKRSIAWLLEWLRQEKSEAAASKMWSRIGDICVMTILSILPTLRREYAGIFEKKTRPPPNMEDSSSDCPGSNANSCEMSGTSRCFELLGVDIMVDGDLRPSLIEVNHLPSWGTDSPIDEDIKSRVITQALSAMNVSAQDRRTYERSRRKQSRIRLRRKQPTGPLEEEVDDANATTDTQPKGKKKRLDLFDSNSAERRIRQVYEKHAPEKLDKVKGLLERYRGYEEWLAKKIEEKYSQDDSDSSTSSEDDESSDDEPMEVLDAKERKRFEREERILKDYDRIYPPPRNDRISISRYREMEKFVTEMDEKQQRRLTCPLQQMQPNGDTDKDCGTHNQYSRGDGWIGGNIHIRSMKEGEAKVTGPPTKQQVAFADRLSRGYSVEDSDVSEKEKAVKRKSRMLHHDLIFEDENPFYHLIDRVKQSRELSKDARRRAELRLHNRASKSGAPLKQQVLQLGLGTPFVELGEKFYSKRRGIDDGG